MGKITKTMQQKHKESLSPWLSEYVASVASAPLPLIPKRLAEFPSRWPFPRGDLYHWIPLLNRFDNILACVSATYQLASGPQPRDFACDILLKKNPDIDYHDDGPWDMAGLADLGYKEDGDSQLLVAILKFTRMLLERSGNRSIYASSSYLSDLLNTTSLTILRATLNVAFELAQRYQASVKRMGIQTRHVTNALLANHYNIQLERVQQIAQPFVKTPIVSFAADAHAATAPSTPSSKGKEKVSSAVAPKSVGPTSANDLAAIAAPDQPDDGRWNGWGDVKIAYIVQPAGGSGPKLHHQQANHSTGDQSHSSLPATPTPLRRSTTGPQHRSPRNERTASGSSDDAAAAASHGRSPVAGSDENAASNLKHFEIPQSAVVSSSIYELLARCPSDMPSSSRFELLDRLRVAKALLGPPEARQLALGVRLLAILNLAYIHTEDVFVEQVLKQDNDEPRRYQLTYQLVELIHPSAAGAAAAPLWLQSIALRLLEGLSHFQTRFNDVISALNANVSHGILLYIIRKTVAGIKEDEPEAGDQVTEADEWRNHLFSLTLNMTVGQRVGTEMMSTGLMDILVEMLNIRTRIADRNISMVLCFLDGVIHSIHGAFQAFVNAHGLDSISQLIIDAVNSARSFVEAGEGTKPEFRSAVVDYEIPYYKQQTLKWLLKLIHHIMTNSFAVGGNTDRLLRNLVDSSQLLRSLRTIMEHSAQFGSMVWTHAVTILSDFLNNDPTSFAAISESGMVQSFLESVTGRPVVLKPQKEASEQDAAEAPDGEDGEQPSSPESDDSIIFPTDERKHPPTKEALEAGRDAPPARSILPSAEAISTIPGILNSISLNTAGMKMVVASRVFDSFLEIFESPAHVNCMVADIDILHVLGSNFDELARHHPPLRPAIANAVLDMVAKVAHLLTRAGASGWGAKLIATGPVAPHKGKEKMTAADDVDMANAGGTNGSIIIPRISTSDQPPTATGDGDVTPYITAVASFLDSYLGNSTLKAQFVESGGTELTLDFLELPSLPYDFAESVAARSLQQVVSQLVEHTPILGWPSLLRRTQTAVDGLSPLISDRGSDSLWAPFLRPVESGDSRPISDDMVVKGTRVVKALLNAQLLLKTLSGCFPFSSRQQSVTFHPVNVFDYYIRLVKSLGVLLRIVLAEEMGVSSVVPKHWSRKNVASQDRLGDPGSVAAAAVTSLPVEGDEPASQDEILTSELLSKPSDESSPSRAKKPTPEEQLSPQYRNYQTLRTLLHSFMPTTFPFFQYLGKALLPRRQRDPYQRLRHFQTADVLAETILDQLSAGDNPSTTDYHYWIVMLHTLHEMLIDHSRQGDRAGVHIIIPVLIAFKERNGFDSLNRMLRIFAAEMNENPEESLDATKSKLAALGMKKILELYALVVTSRNIYESGSQIELTATRSADRTNTSICTQLLVELRMAIMPIARELWESSIIEKISTPILSKLVEVLRMIADSDQEPNAYKRSDERAPPPLFSRETLPFNWSAFTAALGQVTENGDYDIELAREAIYRAQGNPEHATEYCRAHSAGIAGERNPVPAEDAYRPPQSPEPEGEASTHTPAWRSSSSLIASEAAPRLGLEIEALSEDEDLGDADAHSSPDDTSDHEQDSEPRPSEATGANGTPSATASAAQEPAAPAAAASGGRVAVPVEDLDEERAKLHVDLIDRCLDVIRAHPDSVHEISDLLSVTVLKTQDGEKQREVGETVINALMSFGIDEENKKSSARSIAAYAHLLSMLLQRSKLFFERNVGPLRDNVGEYLGFLRIPPGNTSEELPPWLPYILLIFEVLLTDDEQVAEVKWKAPTSESDAVEAPVVETRDPIVKPDDRRALLGVILEILPRIGREEMLAVAVLRILVIMTRDRSVAKVVGEKMNLQRLFVMAKQLSGIGSSRFKETRISANIMIILRHIVEDDDTIRQTMRSEIRNYFESHQRTARAYEVNTYIRQMSHVALRAPDLFVEVTNEMLRLSSRWSTPSTDGSFRPAPTLAIKETAAGPPPAAPPKDDPVEPTVQATEDLNINDVRPSTEVGDQSREEPPKTPANDHKRPIVENPDGVITFLLEQLLNYQKVDDVEIAQPSRDSASAAEPSAPAAAEPGQPARAGPEAEPEKSDKRSSKAPFKPEDHPIFIYRCFLLHCLAELLHSYNRCKIEFINFKRGATLQTNTPVKPRSSVLNYLLNDLLCTSPFHSSVDINTQKKKVATGEQARLVLVALVTKTGEKPVDRSRDRYDFDEEPDLLFVRRFVLDTILRAYKDASTPGEPFEVRYAKMLSLANLMSYMTSGKEKDAAAHGISEAPSTRSQNQIRRLMYEKGYLAALTTSIADMDLTYPKVKESISTILRVLRVLTSTAIHLSRANMISSASPEEVEDEIASASSLSEVEDEREDTPDLYRHSALGMMEPRDEDDFSGESEDEDEEMYDDEYEDEIEYGDEMSADGEDNISDEEEELAEMGDIEGLPGDAGVVEVIMGENEDDDSMDEEEEESSEEEDEDMEDDIEDLVEEIVEAGDDPIDEDAGWEDTSEDGDEGDEVDYEAQGRNLEEVQIHDLTDDQFGRFENMIRATMAEEFDADDIRNFDERFIDDGGEEDEEDDDDEDMEGEEQEFVFDPNFAADEAPPPNLGWDMVVEQVPITGHRHRHGHGTRSPFAPFVFNSPRDPLGEFRNYFRPRSGQASSNPDDGVNPLLRRGAGNARDPSPRAGGYSGVVHLGIPGAAGHSHQHGLMMENPMTFLNDLITNLPGLSRNGQALSFHITHGPRGEFHELNIPLHSGHRHRDTRSQSRRDHTHQDPQQVVSFAVQSTTERWMEEARMIFGPQHADKTPKLFMNRIMAKLTPAAVQRAKLEKAQKEETERKIKEDRERKEAEERKEREAREAEEKAAREKSEAEERERLDREAAAAMEAAATRAAEEAAAAVAADVLNPEGDAEPAESQAMEGIETTTHADEAQTEQGEPGQEQGQGQEAAAAARVVTTIRGEEIDITGLGIDPDYLAALPEEFREEVIAGTVTARRSEARQQAETTGEQTDAFNEFLDALPPDLRVEIMQQERQDQRRRQREEERRQAASIGQDAPPQEMDTASILMTFPDHLRDQVLLEQGEELMAHLPPDMAAQVRTLRERRGPPPPMSRHRDTREAFRIATNAAIADSKVERRTIVQMLDKAGIATLLRLMFITQNGEMRNYLFTIFGDVCENKQNRLEVVNTLLQILQDGSTDMDAVERSFGQLSLKARQPKDKDPKTPNSLKRTYTNISGGNTQAQPSSEISPLLIVQQCLDLLVELSNKNLHIPSLFLTEHEVLGSSLKRTLSRKGKGKDSKASKYAINSLLSLLDRDLVMESSSVMQLLADLLNKITLPLQALERKRKVMAEEKDEPANAASPPAAEAVTAETGTATGPQTSGTVPPPSGGTQESAGGTSAEVSKTQEAKDKEAGPKKMRQLQPPVIPTHNLTLVVNIFVARECSSKTFQNTIATIKNLSNIPGAKAVFGQELVRQARKLSENIVSDLDDLLPHILEAETGTEIQGVALAKFSPGASEQNKLLRVLTALDHLFDTKGRKTEAEGDSSFDEKQEFVNMLYHNATFGVMWEKLSACLSAIRKRENMLNVATILLPLIESLMVVCKNTTLTDAPLSQSQVSKDMLLSSPPPENRIAGLFFTFTEEHRRILNELVRHNPKLMSGTFSLLVKNPKVLEFDNKRNYFNRSVHSKANNQTRASFAPLQLAVRREQVFHDSFRSLYFKSGDEMKHGKLSIRFHGEEGVDAGGVTREWFQVLARQMFDPNYALFSPVSSDRTTFHPNKLSFINEEHLMFFKFIGRIIGKALYEGRLLDCYFSRAVYKRILGKPVSVKDMESFDPEYYKSLMWILEADITDLLDSETFSIQDSEFGVQKTVDLCENGRNIPVTEENKKEYVSLLVEHKLLSSVKAQLENFLQGFHDIIPAELISIFNEQELELLISGLPEIDVDDWKSNSEYHNYTAASPQIQWFWRAVRSFDKEERAKLLQFVTGTSKVPLNGFKELEGMNGVNRFNIHRDYGNKDRLPSSHTCFNQLDLPEYESYETLRSQLLKAITAGSDYFGFA